MAMIQLSLETIARESASGTSGTGCRLKTQDRVEGSER